MYLFIAQMPKDTPVKNVSSAFYFLSRDYSIFNFVLCSDCFDCVPEENLMRIT